MKTVQVQLAASAAYASSRLFTCSVQCSDFGSDNACHPVQKSLVRICDMMQISFSIVSDCHILCQHWPSKNASVGRSIDDFLEVATMLVQTALRTDFAAAAAAVCVAGISRS